MKVLIIGSGGREHAIAWKLAQDSRNLELFCAPGNAGTAELATNIPIGFKDVPNLVRFAIEKGIDFTVAPQDDALAAGVVDIFQCHGKRIFGPTANAAQIESSKAFSKWLMREAEVSTADFEVFSGHDAALRYINMHGAPIVVKASGLALGKGAYVCKTKEQAIAAVDDIMVKQIFGDAGKTVVIEDFIGGPEISIHAFCDGTNFSLFPSAQDHKPAFECDAGPNTGGMGTIASVPWVTKSNMEQISEQIVAPTMAELRRLNRPFVGCLYPGLKMTSTGPKVLEFNARPGDPEMQSYMRLLKTDLLPIMEACVDGKLARCKVEWHDRFAACIILASGGYPGAYKKGLPIIGIGDAEMVRGVNVFHAGTAWVDGKLVTAGGRVLGVTAIGATLAAALKTAYSAAEYIKFEGKQYRSDIGAKSLAMI